MSAAVGAGLAATIWGTTKVGRLLRSMSIDNPKALGRMLRSFGATAKVAADLEKWAQNFRKGSKGKVLDAIERGASLGVVLSLMPESEDIFSTLGSIERIPGSRGDLTGQSTQVMQ